MSYSFYIVRLLARYGAIPLLLLLLVVFLLALRPALTLTLRKSAPGMISLGILVCVAVAAIAIAPSALRGTLSLVNVLRAAMSIPPPVSGPEATGTAILTLPSPAGNSGGPISLQLWYPLASVPPAGKPDAIGCGQLDAAMRLPKAQKPYPFILFGPSLFGPKDQSSLLMRSFASHGYVVAAFDDPALAAPLPGASAEDEAARLLDFDVSSEAAYNATIRHGNLRVGREAAMALTALDRLEACVQDSPALQGRINFKRIGFVGFSFGGATAAEASFMDPRIAAVVNMDGAQFGRSGVEPVAVPYFVFSSGFDWVVHSDPNSSRRYELKLDMDAARLIAKQLKHPESYAFLIEGTFHDAFADPSPTPRTLINWLFLDPYRAQAIVQDYLLGFLDAELKGDRHGLIGPNDPRYPEVRSFDLSL
jgi:dienelactone hydrolase